MLYQPFTYLIGQTKLDVQYYGSKYAKGTTTDALQTTYFTSSKHVSNFRKEHGEPDYIKVHKIFTNKDDTRSFENKILKRAHRNKKTQDKFLNRAVPGIWCVHDGMRGKHHSENTKKKISKSNLGKHSNTVQTDSMRENLSKKLKGKIKSKEHQEKINASLRSSEKMKQKAEKQKGVPRPEHSKKMKELFASKERTLYPTPLGNIEYRNNPYTSDILLGQCNNPDKIISRMQITKIRNGKCKDLFDYSMVGKSRREIGFSEPILPENGLCRIKSKQHYPTKCFGDEL